MRPGGGKGKGGGYEREIGVKLSLWLSHGQRKDLICRTVGSGAQFTTAAKKMISAGHAGDLMSQDPLSQKLCSTHVIECKFWKNLELIKFLDMRGELYEALLKVKNEGSAMNKKWWLIAKQNHQKDFLMMEQEGQIGHHTFFSDTVTVYYLDEFLARVTPEKYLL